MLKKLLHTTIALGGGYVLWSAVHTLHLSALERWSQYRQQIASEVVREYFLSRPVEVEFRKEPRKLDPDNMPRADLSKALYTALGRLDTCEAHIEMAKNMLDAKDLNQ